MDWAPTKFVAVAWNRDVPEPRRLELPTLNYCPHRGDRIQLGDRIYSVREVTHLIDENRIELRLYEW
jgi:hypothetical protein